jgi:hypothetical protein
MVRYKERADIFALAVHTCFSTDADPEVARILKTREYLEMIEKPARRAQKTHDVKQRQDGLIGERWGNGWKEQAQQCMSYDSVIVFAADLLKISAVMFTG